MVCSVYIVCAFGSPHHTKPPLNFEIYLMFVSVHMHMSRARLFFGLKSFRLGRACNFFSSFLLGNELSTQMTRCKFFDVS